MILALLVAAWAATAAVGQPPLRVSCACKAYLSVNFCADLSALGMRPDTAQLVEDRFLLVRELWKPGDTARILDSAWSQEFRHRIRMGAAIASPRCPAAGPSSRSTARGA